MPSEAEIQTMRDSQTRALNRARASESQVVALTEDCDEALAQQARMFTITMFLSVFAMGTGLVVGSQIQRVMPRNGMWVNYVMLVLGLIVLATAGKEWQVIVGFGLLGMGLAPAGPALMSLDLLPGQWDNKMANANHAKVAAAAAAGAAAAAAAAEQAAAAAAQAAA